jgi:hypothetical protein
MADKIGTSLDISSGAACGGGRAGAGASGIVRVNC